MTNLGCGLRCTLPLDDRLDVGLAVIQATAEVVATVGAFVVLLAVLGGLLALVLDDAP